MALGTVSPRGWIFNKVNHSVICFSIFWPGSDSACQGLDLAWRLPSCRILVWWVPSFMHCTASPDVPAPICFESCAAAQYGPLTTLITVISTQMVMQWYRPSWIPFLSWPVCVDCSPGQVPGMRQRQRLEGKTFGQELVSLGNWTAVWLHQDAWIDFFVLSMCTFRELNLIKFGDIRC